MRTILARRPGRERRPLSRQHPPGRRPQRLLLRLLPDVLRLLKRLATDPELPRRVRVALVVLLAFIVSPIDLIPDFIPAIGYADDVIITALVLRWVSRTAGADALARQWPGTPDGLAAVRRLCGMRPE